jgi:hypothetical protein
MYSAYLEKFPKGDFASLARARIASLTLPPRPEPGRSPSPMGVDGTWTGVTSCGPSHLDGAVAFTNLVLTVSDGKISARRSGSRQIMVGSSADQFVYEETYEGQVGPDGSVIITGQGRSSRRGYGIRFDGKIRDGVLDASGLLGDRRCSLHYTRQ